MKKILYILIVFVNTLFSQNIPLHDLKLWFRSDTGITKDISNYISAWKDVSGNNNDLFAYTGEEPIFINSLNEINNFPTISFSNIRGFSFNSTFVIDSFSVFYVGKKNSSNDILTILGDSATFSGVYNWNDGNYYLQEANSYAAIANNNGTDYSVYCISYNQSKIKVYKDGLLTGQSNFNFNGNFFFNQLGRSEYYGSTLSNSEITEIIVYNSSLNLTDRNQIINYLSNKYSTPVFLGNDIMLTNTFCDTSLINNTYQENYLWSTDSTTPTISVNKSGKYWLQATDIFGRVSSDTINVYYPNYNFPLPNAVCLNGQLNWNTSLPKNQYTFQWQDNSTDSVFTITQAGNYYVNITDQFGCSITTDTAHISIDNFSTTATLGPDVSLCSGNLITLTSGASSTNSYTWNTGSTNDSLLITNTGQYSVIATNTNNCVAKDTINVTIVGQAPTANFTSNVGCLNQTVNYTDFSVPPSGNTITSWFWNYGDGTTLSDTSHLQNPFYTYNDTGFYNINLTVETNVGCKQTETKTIHVAPTPTANFSFPSVACQNDSIAFTNQSTNVSGYSISNNNWNFGDIVSGSANISSFTSPKHVFSNNQNYTVKLVTTNSAGCKDSIYQVVQVKAEVKANFNTLQSCTNAPTIFQNTSIGPISSTYQWNFGNSYSNITNPTKLFTNSGVQSVTLSVDGNNGCTSTITKLINVYLPPISDFVVPNFCSKDTIFITNNTIAQSGILSNNSWRLNGNNYSSTFNPSVTLSNAGTYTLSLTAQNSFGCKDSVSKSFTVYPLPNVDYTTNPTTYYYIDSTVFFNPTINNALLYSWSIPSVLTSTIQNAIATFTNAGTYSVTLNLTDINGCSGSKSKTIFVANRLLDLAVLDVKTLKDNFGYVTVIADLVNYGTVPVYSMNIHYTTSDAGNNKETWNGIIYPNSIYTYTFTSKSASKQNEENNITCVEIETVNSVIDDNTQNNYSCNALNIDGISVSNPLPNPTDGDIILPIILNKEINYNIKIFSSTGQLLLDETKNGLEGLNFITLPTSSFARGSYIIKTLIADKQFIKKFIKINQ